MNRTDARRFHGDQSNQSRRVTIDEPIDVSGSNTEQRRGVDTSEPTFSCLKTFYHRGFFDRFDIFVAESFQPFRCVCTGDNERFNGC